jgi:multidrug efflux system outer membrane protein
MLNVEQARALSGVTAANQLPSIGLGAIAQRQPGSSGSLVNTYQAGLQLSAYEIDLFGKMRNQTDAATARYLASSEGARAARIALVAAVASAYLVLQADEEWLALTRKIRLIRQESQRLTQLRFDQGAASSLDLVSSRSALEFSHAAVAQAERQRDQDGNALQLLLGQSLPANLLAAIALSEQRLAELPSGLPSEILAQRPDVLQSEAQLLAANANIGAARAAFFPAVLLTSNLGTASSQLSGLFKNSVWTFVGQALLPIFDNGRNEANLAAARAGREIALAQYEKTVQIAFREVADALAGRASFNLQMQALQAQAQAEAQRLALITLRFANGASNSLELLDAQRASLAAELALLQVRLGRLLNGVQQYKALGGGLI